MKLTILFCLFLLITVAFGQQQEQEANKDLVNTDDSSLFRGVENAIDESTEEDDAYRILQSLQDVKDEGEEDSDEENELDEIDSALSEQNHDDDDDDNDNDNDNDNDDDNDDDDDEEDFGSNFPEFQNEETTEFFKNLPQQASNKAPTQEEVEQKVDNVNQEEEEFDEEPVEETEKEEEEEEEIVEVDRLSPPAEGTEQFIPWRRPDNLAKVENTDFYQDVNFRDSPQSTQKSSQFKFWHFLCILAVFLMIYCRPSRRTSNNLTELSNTGSTSSSWHNNNEKDFLPSHNYNNNKHFKFG